MSALRAGWLLDLGNTRLKLAWLEADGRRGEVQAFANADAAAAVARVVQRGRAGDVAWLASVAAAGHTAAVDAALRAAGFDVRRVQSQSQRGRLRIAYAEPARLGADRFLAMLAASERHDGPWLLVSAGSALTVDLLSADGLHAGGLIAPMPATMRAALGARFAQLDVMPGASVVFATDTADAVASGCDGAALGLVERSLRLARARFGTTPTLLVGGGDAALFDALEHAPRETVPALVLDGLAAYARGEPA